MLKILLKPLPAARLKTGFQFRSVSNTSGKVYELRTYAIKPECMKDFLSLTSENFHIRTRASVLHGYWSVEFGGINQMVHLWEYDSYDHRAKVRAQLAQNSDWIGQYFGKVVSMFQWQDNMTLRILNFGGKCQDILYPEGKGVYELWRFRHNGDLKNLGSQLSKLEESSAGESTLCAAFTSEFGPYNSSVVIWRHNSFDFAPNLRSKLEPASASANPLKLDNLETKALIPLSISPMQ